MSDKIDSRVRERGWRAYHRGELRTVNPYRDGTSNYWLWLQGWLAGKSW